MQGIGLDLPKSFWKRICDRNYKFKIDDLDEIDNSDTEFGGKHYTPLNWGEFAVGQLIADNAGGDAESPTTHESIKNKLRNIDC